MRNDYLRSALGNIGTKVVFAVDRVDAEILAKKLFAIDVEEIKHEVVDEVQQDRIHPMYYTVGEGWEQAIQSIQTLNPRTCLVKMPQRSVKKLHTLPVPAISLSPEQWSRVHTVLKHDFAATKPAEPTDWTPTYYEEIPSVSNSKRVRVSLS